MGLKGKLMIGCTCLLVLVVTLWIVRPDFSASTPNPPAVVDTSPVVTYTFEQQQGAFKSWMQEFESKTNAVNEQWEMLNKILAENEQEAIYEKLDAVQQKLQNLEGTYSALQPPKELTIEQQTTLKRVTHDMDKSISSRIKFIKFTEAYMLQQRNKFYRQSQQEKALIDMYQSNCSLEIEKLAETFKIKEVIKR